MGYTILKMILAPLLRLAFRVDVKGSENVPRDGKVILAANHVSFIDSLFIPLVLARRVTFLAKAEYFDNPRVAWFFRMAGQIPIKREGGSASERALAAAREVLDDGGVLAIYPEGTRSPDGRLYRGRTGVARMALSCDTPVVPVALFGTADVQPVGARFPRPFRSVGVTFGTPLRWPELAGASNDGDVLRKVTDEIVDAIGQMTGQERVDRYAKQRRSDLPEGVVPLSQVAVDVSPSPSAERRTGE